MTPCPSTDLLWRYALEREAARRQRAWRVASVLWCLLVAALCLVAGWWVA